MDTQHVNRVAQKFHSPFNFPFYWLHLPLIKNSKFTKNLEYEHEIYKNLENFESVFEFFVNFESIFEFFVISSFLSMVDELSISLD